MLKKIISACLVIFCLLYIFKNYLVQVQAINQGTVVINEVAWMGGVVSVNDEWLELYNPSLIEVDLTGWNLSAASGTPNINLKGVIPAGGFYLLERTDDDSVPGVLAQQIYSGALGNEGDDLVLKNKDGSVIDKISAQAGWPAGDKVKKLTIERDSNGFWRSSQGAGGTPGSPNSVLGVEPGGEVTSPEADGQETGVPIVVGPEKPAVVVISDASRLGEVVVNELVSDPGDGDSEWVELFNTTKKRIDLIGWWLEDGSGAKTTLKGAIGTAGADRFFVVEKPKGSLNNKGDSVLLKSAGGRLIDKVVYGDWNDGDQSTNAPTAADPFSLARIIDGNNSHNNVSDFTLTETITKKAANVITLSSDLKSAASALVATKADFDYSTSIIITEVLPNPEGLDTEKEFVELLNSGSTTINLFGWTLMNVNGKKYEFLSLKDKDKKEYLIQAGEYLAVFRKESKIAFNNSADTVKLFQPLALKPLVNVEYKKAREKESFALADTGLGIKAGIPNYEWTNKPTPGTKNNVKVKNLPPATDFDCPTEIVMGQALVFDSSDTVDEEGDTLSYLWDFGDGATSSLCLPEHTFRKSGSFTVKLSVSDLENRTEKEKILKVVAVTGYSSVLSATSNSLVINEADLIINEIMPNTKGSDDGEWIEFFNQGGVRINLLNWQIDDAEGGSKPFVFKEEIFVEAGKYFVLERKRSGLALNNTSDAIRLFGSDKRILSSIDYEKAKEGEAYAQGLNNKWFWTSSPTKGKVNVIRVAEEGSGQTNNFKFQISNFKSNPKSKIQNKPFEEVALGEFGRLEVGDFVTTSGTVAVLPGIFGAQYLYVVTAGNTASDPDLDSVETAVGSTTESSIKPAGLQIYNYKKDFPELRVGDLISVSGEIAMSQEEKRLKTKDKSDIKVIKNDKVPRAEEFLIEKVNEELVGRLIMVSGELVQRKSSLIIINDDTGELGVYIKRASGIPLSSLKEGAKLSIIGILVKAKTGLQLLPRSTEDVIRIYEDGGADSTVLGEVPAGAEWELAKRDSRLNLYRYCLILGCGLVIFLVGVLWRKRALLFDK